MNPSEIADALTKYAPDYVEHPRYDGTSIRIPMVWTASSRRIAICLRDNNCRTAAGPNVKGELNYFDQLAYGSGYGVDSTAYEFTINLNDIGSSLTLASSQSFSNSNQILPENTVPNFSTERDVQLKFTAYISRVLQNRTPIEMVLNGDVIHTTTLPNTLVSEYPVRYVINRNLFADGENVIQLRTQRGSATWESKRLVLSLMK